MTDKKIIQDLNQKGYKMKEMLKMIHEESLKDDISDKDKCNLIFLRGFLIGAFSSKEDIEANIKNAITICRRIDFKYMENPSDKLN